MECDHKGKYLGLPFCNFSSKSAAFKHIEEKLSHKLSGWKGRCLSLAGRSTFIKHIVQALPGYTMQIFMLPKGTLARMDISIQSFFWNFEQTRQHHLVLKTWNTICLPKFVGVYGREDLNKSLITNLGWQISKGSEKTWIQLIRSKYLRNRTFWMLPRGYGGAQCIDLLDVTRWDLPRQSLRDLKSQTTFSVLHNCSLLGTSFHLLNNTVIES